VVTPAEMFSLVAGRLQRQTPLIHHITSHVVAQVTADATLAVGGSPIMAEAEEDVGEVSRQADAVVLNMGTITDRKLPAMDRAREVAAACGIPVVLDPVGAGFTSYRSRLAEHLLRRPVPAVIRGNSSEVAALAGVEHSGRGVDADGGHIDFSIYRDLARRLGTVVVATGPIDVVSSGARTFIIEHGDQMMATITASGCTVTAVVAVFAAVGGEDFMSAAAAAVAFCGLAGQRAAAEARGPGDFRSVWLNQLYLIMRSPPQKAEWNIKEVGTS